MRRVSGDLHVLQVTYSTVPAISTPNENRTKQRTDVSSQDILDLLLLEPTTDDQPPAAVHAARGAHLREHKRNDVLGLAVHAPTDITNVCEYGTLVSIPMDRGRRESVPLRTGERESGVCGVERAEKSI